MTHLALMGFTLLVNLALVGLWLVQGMSPLNPQVAASVLVALVLGAICFSYWRGWRPARYLFVCLVTLATITVLPPENAIDRPTFAVLVAPVVALILAGPWWVVGCTLAIVLGMVVRAGGQGLYTDPIHLLLMSLVVGGMLLSQRLMDLAQQATQRERERAEAARLEAEASAHALSAQRAALEERNAEQRRLLDLVSALETPVITLAEGVLLAPVVGNLDSRRAAALTARLLEAVRAARGRAVILDIAGVLTVDTAVAQALLRTTQALRLLGCAVTITGISATVAATMTTLGISLEGVRTARTPQDALDGARDTASPGWR